MNEYIRVLKRNLKGEVTWQYEGRVLRREPNAVVLEAYFNRPDMPFVDTVFKQNDRFVETFYMDRWYNIFEVHDRDDGGLKGWYCNVGRPAEVGPDTVSYVDLALDLWVSADGRQTVLDEDEFAALKLGSEERATARSALEELKALFESKRPPR
jgi:protein associated with RNAse G/E